MATSTEEKKKPSPWKRFWSNLWNRPLVGTVIFGCFGLALYKQEHLAYQILFGTIATLGFLYGAATIRVVFHKGLPGLFKK